MLQRRLPTKVLRKEKPLEGRSHWITYKQEGGGERERERERGREASEREGMSERPRERALIRKYSWNNEYEGRQQWRR